MIELKSLLFSMPRVRLTWSCLILAATLQSMQNHLYLTRRPKPKLIEVIHPVPGPSRGSTRPLEISPPRYVRVSSPRPTASPLWPRGFCKHGISGFQPNVWLHHSFHLCCKSIPISSTWGHSFSHLLISAHASSLLIIPFRLLTCSDYLCV